MYEQEKLDEARYFFMRMAQSPEPTTFRFELSAFLSAARSALLYALAEARGKLDGQVWYDAQVSGKAVVNFFKGQRNISIHRQPVVPTTSANITVTETCRLSEALHLEMINTDGQVVREVSVGTPPSPLPPTRPAVVTYTYTFADWNGPEDVLSLSSQYLAEVQTLVRDGVTEGILSP